MAPNHAAAAQIVQRAPTERSLRTCLYDVGLAGAELLAAIFCSLPLILKFRHSTEARTTSTTALTCSTAAASASPDWRRPTFMHTTDPNQRLRWRNVRAIKMSPDRGFWLRYRRCSHHIDLRATSAEKIRDAIGEVVQTKLHPEGFDYAGHCCFNFAEDLMAIIADVVGNDHVRVPVSNTNPFGLCCSTALETYLQSHGFDAALCCLALQEKKETEANLYGVCGSCCRLRTPPTMPVVASNNAPIPRTSTLPTLPTITPDSNGCPWDARVCSGAAYSGHIQVLKWARTNGFMLTSALGLEIKMLFQSLARREVPAQGPNFGS
ncbi:hypothetical protein CTAYLR_010461 [Chrysophaeum taylorii]|uniref:Uncharacterized protein n=1 Tax=Chrysophaeum taylorii TaxID=2483200 RepID=A0AAD7U5Y6_9STRA|nr:hypothetical protein CTAYLR_010461 [Chrysophaeum taylorii]